jgi:iron uptake system EfeUOB component EfeO/EfeM
MFITLLAISGCSSAVKQEPAKNAQVSEKTLAENAEKDGLTKLLKTARQLRKAALAGDEAKIKEYGPKLEEVWSKFEDGIKTKYPGLYDQVEKNLNPAVAATKAAAIDKDAILKLDNQLLKVLYDLAQKIIPVEQVKAGATQLINLTQEIRKAIEAGDEAKIKVIGPRLEDIWSSFEDGVKPRNEDLYEEIEKSLNPEVAGSQKSPLDKETLEILNKNLEQSLNKLIETTK